MPDVQVRPSSVHGKGVFATRNFDSGEIIMVIDDSRVVDDTHPLRPELGEHDYHSICPY